jgi:hypothetical protein
MGVSDSRQELARSPGKSSHYASPYRTELYKNLGLKESGFFADWRTRTQSEQATADDTGPLEDTTATNIQGPTLNPFGQAGITAQLPEKAPGKTQFQPPQEDQQQGGSFTGETRNALRMAELQVVNSQIRGRIASNQLLSTGVLDTMNATMINMDRQIVMDMDRNPSILLGQATMDYFMSHNKPATEATNFEKIVGAYSETKKIAQKNVNYAGAEMAKKMAQLKKNPSSYQGAGSMLNIGSTGSYSPSYYSPPL